MLLINNVNKTKLFKALAQESYSPKKTFYSAVRSVFSRSEIRPLCSLLFPHPPLNSKSASWFAKASPSLIQ